MSRTRFSVCLLAAGLTLTACGSDSGSRPEHSNAKPATALPTVLAPASWQDPLPMGQTVSIEPAAGLTFVPADPPASNTAYLSAADAWAKWEHGEALEPGMNPQFGVVTQLTAAANTPGVQTVVDGQTVWAYRQPECMEPMTGTTRLSHHQSELANASSAAVAPSASPDPSSREPSSAASTNQFGPCVVWTFLDASTGEEVLLTQQTVS